MSKMQDIQPEEWDQLESPDFPFTDYAYLRALEDSGSVGEEAGWNPRHLWEPGLEGASILYEKNNSYGEYIFDWAWAEAYMRHGVPYYPKLVSAVPFTPAVGRKLLFSAAADNEVVAERLLKTAVGLLESSGFSSLHYLFLHESELSYFERAGFLLRHSFHYVWKNAGYGSFDDFLLALKPRKRKQILREREQLGQEGITIRMLRGAELAGWAKVFYPFYLTTIYKMEATPYLKPSFFEAVFQSMQDSIIFFVAEAKGTPIAGALFYQKGNSLFGRYWGAVEEVRHLHFELCYYRPIEWAIANKIERFEAGAQGEHKIARGFVPELTYSAHRIQHPAFGEAIARFIEEEKTAISRLFSELKTHSPYLLP